MSHKHHKHHHRHHDAATDQSTAAQTPSVSSSQDGCSSAPDNSSLAVKVSVTSSSSSSQPAVSPSSSSQPAVSPSSSSQPAVSSSSSQPVVASSSSSDGDADVNDPEFLLNESAGQWQWPSTAGETNALHRAVFRRDHAEIRRLVAEHAHLSWAEKRKYFDCRDSQGNTALHIAAHFGDIETIELLRSVGARSEPSDAGWTPLQEAAASGYREAVACLWSYGMDQARRSLQCRSRLAAKELASLPDFYLEIHWAFSTWIPFLSRWFPSDTYRLWKIGDAIRVDISLIGFENMQFKTGHNSLIFTGSKHSQPYECMILNRVEKTVAFVKDNLDGGDAKARQLAVDNFLSGKHSLSTRNIHGNVKFNRSSSFFGREITEDVGNYSAHKYHTSGLTYVHAKRRDPKARSAGVAREPRDPAAWLSEDDYFSPPCAYQKGRGLLWPDEQLLVAERDYNADIWLSPDFPFTLKELLPLFQALCPLSEEFQRLKDFVELSFPDDGFPVKLVVPGIYYIITATVSFSNFKYISPDTVPSDHFAIPSDFQRATDLFQAAMQSSLGYQDRVRTDGTLGTHAYSGYSERQPDKPVLSTIQQDQIEEDDDNNDDYN